MRCVKCKGDTHVLEVSITNVTVGCFYCGWRKYYAPTLLDIPADPPPKKRRWQCQNCGRVFYDHYYKKYCKPCRLKIRQQQLRNNQRRYLRKMGKASRHKPPVWLRKKTHA